jgi:hypothetical protein
MLWGSSIIRHIVAQYVFNNVRMYISCFVKHQTDSLEMRDICMAFGYRPIDRWSRDSAEGTAMGWMAGVRFDSSRGKRFFFLLRVQTGSGAHTPSFAMATVDSFPRGQSGRVTILTISSIYCRGQEWPIFTSIPQHIFNAWWLVS